MIIQFGNQQWNSPRVVGFASNPRQCGLIIAAYSELDSSAVDIGTVHLYHPDPGGTYLVAYTEGVDYEVTISGNIAEFKLLTMIPAAHILITPATAHHLPWYICNADFASTAAYIAGGGLPVEGVSYGVRLPYYKEGTFSRTGITTYNWMGGQELPGGYYGSPEDGFVYKASAGIGLPVTLPGLSVFMSDNEVNHVHKDIYDWNYYALPVTLSVSYSGIVRSASVKIMMGAGMGIYGIRSIFDDGLTPFGDPKVDYSPAAVWQITSNIPALNETFLNPNFAFAHYLQGAIEADSGYVNITVSASGGSGTYDHSRMPDGIIDCSSLGPSVSLKYIKNTMA